MEFEIWGRVIGREIMYFYLRLYNEDRSSCLSLRGVEQRPVCKSKVETLLGGKTIWTLHTGKTPGPASFSIAFFQACWDIKT